MNRLWVRFSLINIALIIIVVLLPLTIFNSIQFRVRRAEFLERQELEAPAEIKPPGPPPENNVISGIPNRFLITALGTGVVGILAGIWASRSLSAPIAQLAEAAQEIGKGDLSHRVAVKGGQEIQELAESINRMAADLELGVKLRQNLIADVAHELRTPLTALESNLRAAIDQIYELNEGEIANLYSQTSHLIRLVNDLALLFQAEGGQLPLVHQQTELSPLLEETIAIFEPLAVEKGVQFNRQLTDECPNVHCDASRIRQVLHNLLGNALRYTSQGDSINVSLSQAGDEVQVAIQDTGEGIHPDHLPFIFERFYRTDVSRSRDTGGSGLGLSIAKAIIEAHHGRLEASSLGVGKGSVFTIFLPISPSLPDEESL